VQAHVADEDGQVDAGACDSPWRRRLRPIAVGGHGGRARLSMSPRMTTAGGGSAMASAGACARARPASSQVGVVGVVDDADDALATAR
jgi:hypothetical protein